MSGESLTLTGNIDSSLTTTGTLPNSSIGNGGNITLSVSNTNLSLSGRTLNAETKINSVTNSTGPVGGAINLISNDSIIVSNSTITTNRNSIILNSDRDANNSGAIQVTGTTITSNGGNIILGGGANGTTAAIGTATNKSGIELNNSTLTAGNGTIRLTGTGGNSGDLSDGIFVHNGSHISTTGLGNLTLTGTGGGSGISNRGVNISKSHLSTALGAILVEGTGGSSAEGIRQISGSSVTSSEGNITYIGNATDPNSFGIWVQFSNSGVNNIIGNTSEIVTLRADSINFSNVEISPHASGTSQLAIQPLDPARGIRINSFANGNLNLSNTDLDSIQDGFSLITIGRADGTGIINIGSATFQDNVLIQTPQGTGTINVNGLLASLDSNITLNAAQDINVNSLSGIVSGTGNITLDAGRDISFNAISGIVDGTGNILLDAGRNVSFSSFTAGLDWKGNITVIAVNDISFTNAVLGTTENISLSAGGNATQAGTSSLLVNSLEILGAGNFTLNSATNNISTLAGNSTGLLSFTNTNGFDITELQANQLTLTSGGVLTQSGAITATGATTLNVGSYDITLTLNNDFATLGLTAANATIVDQNALELTASTLTGNLSVTTNGTLTQSGAISAQGLAILGTGNTVLDHPNNQIQTLAADTTGSLTVVTTTDLTIGTVNPTGIENADTVFLQSTGGDIILKQSINATDDITLVAAQNFINTFGANALNSTAGRWVIYATSPQGNVNGWSALGGSEQFSTTYPTPPSFAGNGFIYTVAAPIIPVVSRPVTPATSSAPIVVTSPRPEPPPQSPALNSPPASFTPAAVPLPPNLSRVLLGEEEENLPIEKTLCQLVEASDVPLDVDGIPVEPTLAEQCR